MGTAPTAGPGPDDVVVGVDIGGTGIKGAPVDVGGGRFSAERVRILTPQPATPAAVVEVVRQVLDQLGTPGPVGITLPSVVRGGVVHTAANIDESWIGQNADQLFSEALSRPVTTINDADAAGIAEVRYGAGRDQSGTVLLITLGTGIGSALFADGVLVPNTELGHLRIHHLDAEDWAADSVRVAEDVTWKQWAHRLQKYLEMLERVLQPDLFIVGGGVSKKSEKFLPHIDIRTRIVPAQLHNDAGIIGAAAGSGSGSGSGSGTGPA